MGLARELIERTTSEYLPIGLHEQHRDWSIRARIERGVERPVRVQPRDAASRRAIHRCEVTADQHLRVCLQRNDFYERAVHDWIEIAFGELSGTSRRENSQQ